MKIEKGEKILVVRYSDFLINDCISYHKETLKEYGYCWFGKMGTKVSQKNRDIIINNENPKIILHSSKEDYLCNIEDIVFEKPIEGYPKYYEEVLYSNKRFPSSYLKLKNIIPLKKKHLNNFIIASSRNVLPESLHKSMNSMFMTVCVESFEI